MISASTLALEDVGLLLALALDLLDLGLGLVDDLVLALFALADGLDGDRFHQRDGSVECGLADLRHELDAGQSDVDQLDAAALLTLALAGLGQAALGVLLDLGRDLEPAQRDRFLGLGRNDEVENGLVLVGVGPFLAGCRRPVATSRAGGPAYRSSCGWCSERSRPACGS